MKVRFIFLFFLCVCTVKAFTYPFENQEYVYTGYYDDMTGPGFKMLFKNGKLELDIPEFDLVKNEEGIFIGYTLSEAYSLEAYKDFLFLQTKTRRFMVLYFQNLICVLIDCKSGDTLWGLRRDSSYVRLPKAPRWKDLWIGIDDVSLSFTEFSSVLKETLNNSPVVYNGKSKFYLQIGNSWVPAGGNNGIGEWVEKKFGRETQELVIVNGFVKADSPDWYYNNARLKKIIIETEQGAWSFILDDSPHPQVIRLPKSVTGAVKVIVKDVYPGSKYKDVCLGGLYMLNKAPEL